MPSEISQIQSYWSKLDQIDANLAMKNNGVDTPLVKIALVLVKGEEATHNAGHFIRNIFNQYSNDNTSCVTLQNGLGHYEILRTCVLKSNISMVAGSTTMGATQTPINQFDLKSELEHSGDSSTVYCMSRGNTVLADAECPAMHRLAMVCCFE